MSEVATVYCECGCSLPITNKNKFMSTRQKYIVGHSPHWYGMTRRIKEVLPDGPRYPVAPTCCPKCQGTMLVKEIVLEMTDQELETAAYRCVYCGFRGYI